MLRPVTLPGVPDDSDHVTADTPGDDASSLMRTSDHVRVLLRKAQLALAALAVPVSMAVGTIIADPASTHVTPTVTQAGPDLVANSDHPPAQPGPVIALARADEIAGRVAEAATDRRRVGVLAGLTTLAICWSVLFATGAIWRRTLADRDLRDWGSDWERVEPRWSDRRV
jgi:hypothetical protein